MSTFFWGLKKAGVLGMNSRNLDYIFPNNPRRNYPNVDNKLLSKQLAQQNGIPVPELYGVIETQRDVARLADIIGNRRDFVIKPARGSGGGGIIVIANRNKAGFVRASGRVVQLETLEYHVGGILSGLFSLGGVRDVAIIEQRIQVAELFVPVAYQGVPDIRLVVYKGVTVMAMLRLPTFESDGRANLHAGGIGVGVDMATGQTTRGVLRNQFIDAHVDTGNRLEHIQLPSWPHMLAIGTKCSEMVGMGYIGVDLILDDTVGPMLLEINARPGISIQVANRAGLKGRLDKVDAVIDTLKTTEDKVAFAMSAFPAGGA
jgi:alpha-L-glutamate ligase-like protein